MTMTKEQFEAVCDGIFEANNYFVEKNTASEKIEILPGDPGSPERIQTYREKIERGETLFEE